MRKRIRIIAMSVGVVALLSMLLTAYEITGASSVHASAGASHQGFEYHLLSTSQPKTFPVPARSSGTIRYVIIRDCLNVYINLYNPQLDVIIESEVFCTLIAAC